MSTRGARRIVVARTSPGGATRAVLLGSLLLCACATAPVRAPLARPTTIAPHDVVATREAPRVPLSAAIGAWAEYTRAIELRPDQPDAWYNLAQLYLATDRSIASLECARTLLGAFVERARDPIRHSSQLDHARALLHPGPAHIEALAAMDSLPGVSASRASPRAAVSSLPSAPPLPTCPYVPPYDGERRAGR